MSTLVLQAPFDPITAEELAYIRVRQKQPGVHRILLQAEPEGIASLQRRHEFLKRAAKPYRHIDVTTDQQSAERLPEQLILGEAEVRSGVFRKGAPGIVRMLAEDGDYFETMAQACCKESRFRHSQSVAEVCALLARAHHMDESLAWKAGILHDVTKKWSAEEGRALLEVYEPDAVAFAEPVYHSFTCPIVLRTQCGIVNHKLLHAIETHTLGDGNGDLDRILYIADKIEPTRGYDTTREMNLALKDLKAAFKLVYEEASEYRKRKSNG
ncbi:MAG: bis(5'-nucleosyl)-tetraphosphatase (symmetrical) YqeK [Solobacterium sp.]|nr:bis(5'-nucleosyl)-tetraphosphatase (symmetrical) YqeK [Solobacterium sp.]